MEWTPNNYEKLMANVKIKIKKLEIEKRKSDDNRHKLYRKGDNGEKLTPEENARIKQMCNREDEINDEINHLIELKVNVCKALDKLEESI
jgi:chromosome segregation ATPase